MNLIETPRPATTLTAARDALTSQLEGQSRHFGFSLDALWRAAGEPDRQSVADWLDLARPVVDGMTAYRRRVHAATAHEQPNPFVIREKVWYVNKVTLAAIVAVLGNPGPFEIGDTVADEETAALYAMFLDLGGLRRNLTKQGYRDHARFAEKIALLPPAGKVRVLDPAPEAIGTTKGTAHLLSLADCSLGN